MASTLDLGKVMGSQMFDVSSVPDDSLGLNGDWAFNAATGDVYMKVNDIWQTKGNIKGAKGDTGATGAAGTDGVDGADGKTPTLSINAQGHLIATYE